MADKSVTPHLPTQPQEIADDVVSDTTNLTPMVVSGTHSLDMSMWLLEGRTPVEVYARSVDRTLGPLGTKDGTFGVFTMDDGVVFSMNINWALPAQWPGAVYGLEIGIVGIKGVIDIEDTHRDVVLASEIGQPAGYRSARPDQAIGEVVRVRVAPFT